MPYIDPGLREAIDLGDLTPATPGELNYAITMLCANYIQEHGLSYTAINDVLGALSGATLEFYRRVAVAHESTKLATNGDVYG